MHKKWRPPSNLCVVIVLTIAATCGFGVSKASAQKVRYIAKIGGMIFHTKGEAENFYVGANEGWLTKWPKVACEPRADTKVIILDEQPGFEYEGTIHIMYRVQVASGLLKGCVGYTLDEFFRD
jgi:hypothetical protein